MNRESRSRSQHVKRKPGMDAAPLFSIIIPVHNQAELLRGCLASIRASAFEDCEVIVSDDGSGDAHSIRSVAESYGARTIRSETRTGSAGARNRGVAASAGSWLVFFDADVTVHADTLQRLADATGPDVDAVIGSYDNQPTATGRSSQFRNLMHAHVHQRSRPEACTFWTACGAVSREQFLAAGGFDESYREPSIEDAEFGIRLHKGGGRIRLVREILVTHHKAWSFSAMVKADLLLRAIPWAGLLREHGLPRDLNFRLRDRAAVVLTTLAVPSALVALRQGIAWWIICAMCLLSAALAQNALLRWLRTVRGTRFAFTCIPLLLVYNLVCAAGLAAGVVKAEWRRDRRLFPAMASFAALVLVLQTWGGAWQAEFTAHGDEPRHFISGLMVYDWLTQFPRENPLSWAAHYYLHYPLVSIGHWPPGYYVMEALWWLLFTPSRVSALALQSLLAVAGGAIFYRMLRDLAPKAVALGATLLLLASPVLQQSFDLTMADLTCMVITLFFMRVVAMLAAQPDPKLLLAAAGWIVLALLTKGSGACLIPTPVLALLMTGKARSIPRVWIGWCFAGVVTAGLGWYAVSVGVLHMSLARFAGISARAPWRIDLVPELLGYGFLGLTVGGLAITLVRRRPVAVAAGATLLSVVAVSAVLRAMAEPRHWIIVTPALLILAVELLVTLRGRVVPALLTAAALILFPFQIFYQAPQGFAALTATIHRPARLMASSSWTGEGAWVSAMAMTEKRPGSVVIRAGETLASSGLRPRDYRLLAQSGVEVEKRLDELGIDTAGIYFSEGETAPPDQDILMKTLRTSASWKQCGGQKNLLLYCRITSPAWPRKRLEIDLPKFNLKFSE